MSQGKKKRLVVLTGAGMSAESDLHDLGSYHPRPYEVVLLRDNRGGELLSEPEIASREDEEEYPLCFPHPSMHEEMEAALPFFSIMASVDAEYLCSLGLTMEDAYIFIPLRHKKTETPHHDL